MGWWLPILELDKKSLRLCVSYVNATIHPILSIMLPILATTHIYAPTFIKNLEIL
jgi:hypothetical protein